MSDQEKKNNSGIEGYKLLKKLGKGGMATVYLGVQECFDREVAIKVMQPNPSDPSYSERFIREAKIIAQVSHPNIVHVYDVGVSGKHNYMAMEYLPGGDLSAKISQGLSHAEIIRITQEIANALEFAHKKGYVHRDVKPDNIMFRENGTAVLTDFGIARPKATDTNMTQIGKIIGTPKYMSPEQTKGDELDGRSDLYALGILLYEMLTGKVPFEGKDAFEIGIKHLKDPVPALPQSAQIFQNLVSRLLAKNVNRRIQTGQQVIEALANIAQGKPTNIPSNNSEAITVTGFNDNKESKEGKAGLVADRGDRNAAPSKPETAAPVKNNRTALIAIILLLIISTAFASVWFAPQIAPQSPLMAANKALMDLIYPERAALREALANAAQAMEKENYLSPIEQSALHYYRQALAIEASNQEALDGLERIIRIYIDKALVEIDGNNFDTAEELLVNAKQVKGETAEIIAALEAIDSKKLRLAQASEDEQRAAAEKARLARQAAAQKAADEKAHQAALRSQQQAKEAAAAAAAAKEAASKLAAIAEQERLAKAEAERLKQEEQARLLAEQKASQQRMINIQVTALLNKADTYMARGDYRSPAQENALEKYQAAKALSPDNRQAQAGIEKVVTLLIPEIDELLKAQQVGMAKNLFDQLIEAAPDHPDLIEIGQAKAW